MKDPTLLDYSPPRAAALRRELEILRNLLWTVYTYREDSSYGGLYEGDGEIQFSLRHLVVAQSDLEKRVRRLLQSYSSILIYVSSWDDVLQWRSEVQQATHETSAIDPDDPSEESFIGRELLSAIGTINEWLDELARDSRWSTYFLRYILHNRLQLITALFVGILARAFFDTVLAPILGLSALLGTLPERSRHLRESSRCRRS